MSRLAAITTGSWRRRSSTSLSRCDPKRLLGDTAYGDSETREALEERAVEVLAPVSESPPRPGRIGKGDFLIDLAAGAVTCPAGHVAAIGPPQRSWTAVLVNLHPIEAALTASTS